MIKKTFLFIMVLFLTGFTNNTNLIIPGKQVNNYIIGKSTLKEILGQNTAENRNKYAKKGLYFQFEQGDKLSGITVMSSEYTTDKGVRVGSTIEEAIKAYGKPKERIMDDTLTNIGALVYDGIVFFCNNEKITAIHVANITR
jgi:hypothetical protein